MSQLLDSLLTRYLREYNAKHLNLEFSPEMSLRPDPEKQYLLYIHIPFCESLCPFCSFHRVKMNEDRARGYFSALKKEIRLYHQAGFRFGDVYVGGGTPTVLPDMLADVLHLLHSLFNIGEISVETNPNHLRMQVLNLLKDAGVTRLSVGVQSLDDTLLKEMGRHDAYGDSRAIISGLESTQGIFDTFNVDMIFNFPHQTRESLFKDIGLLKGIGVDQISYYPLMPSEVTERTMSKNIGYVEFGREREFYELISNSLLPDYQRVSAWCFSNKTSSIDEYIVDHDQYLGVGSGSFSYMNGSIYSTTFSINKYLSMIDLGKIPVTAHRELSVKERAQYDFLIRLFGGRMVKSDLEACYGSVYVSLLRKEILLFKTLGALRETKHAYEVTDQGRYLWVLMMREFFIGVNNFRSQMRGYIHDEGESLNFHPKD